MPTCSQCHAEITCDAHEHNVLPVVPCESTACAIWVRALDHRNQPVAGLRVRLDQAEDTTDPRGFARFEGLAPWTHDLRFELTGEASERYLAPEPATREEALGANELKLVVVRLAPRVRPLVELSATAVHVGGQLRITVKTDRAYAGKGTLTCTRGGNSLQLDAPIGEVDFAALDSTTGKTFTAEVVATSELDGVTFGWAIDAASQLGPDASASATAVAASLRPHARSGVLADERRSQAPGLTVHLQDQAKQRRRAPLDLVIEPAQLAGKVRLEIRGDGKLAVSRKAEPDAPLELSEPIDVGPDHDGALLLEGTSVSKSSGDIEVLLHFVGHDRPVDRFVATVVQTRLVPHAYRTGDRKDDPEPLPAGERLVPGHTLIKHVARQVQRSRLAVEKLPADCPCTVRLVAAKGGDAIRVFPAAEEVTVDELGTKERLAFENEREHEGEAHDLTNGLDLDGVTTPEGWVFWVEGASTTSERGVELQLDIDDVDTRCDAMAYTVADPGLTIELVRSDGIALSADVDVEVVPVGKTVATATGVVPKDAGQVAITVPAGSYMVRFAPRGVAEQPMRVQRLTPKSSDAAVAVVAATTAKFELAPAYTKVQLVAHWVGAYDFRGIDQPKTDYPERVAEAMADMQEKAAIMKQAIIAASTTDRKAHIDAARSTLKVFMAPEFYFRGTQGAYPIDVVSEITKELAGEIDKDVYDDWLFVLGTAIGAIDPPVPVNDPAKQAKGTIEAATAEPDVTDPMSGTNALKAAKLTLVYDGDTRPANGWTMLTPFVATVVAVEPGGPANKSPKLVVSYPPGAAVDLTLLPTQDASFEDPAEVEIANVAIVRKGGLAGPCGADGRVLRELLIEKDYVAWADLDTAVDKNHGRFFAEGHQLIRLFGQLCRARPPAGSFMPGYFGWSNAQAPNRSEINTSGAGGGSVFTLDDITFGLEVCMDHGLGARLRKYYGRNGELTAPRTTAGEPRVQVQLVPAGGMGIQAANIVTVVDGLVFNVDVATNNVVAVKTTAEPDWTSAVPYTPIGDKGWSKLAVDVSAHFASNEAWLRVFEAADLPPPATVA